MGDMTVDELKDKKLWFLWSAKPGGNGKVTKVSFAANGGATGTDDAHRGTWVSFDDAELQDSSTSIQLVSQKSVSGIGAWLEDSERLLLIRYRP